MSDSLRARITDIRWGACSDGQDRIAFKFDGVERTAILRGRNASLVLTGDTETNASVVVRCILDGHMEE